MTNGLTEVETLKPHHNPLGDKHEKAVGDTYTVPDGMAHQLVAQRLVKRVPQAEAPAPVTKAEQARK